MKSLDIYGILSEAGRNEYEKAGGEILATLAAKSPLLKTYEQKWDAITCGLEKFWRQYSPDRAMPSTFVYRFSKPCMHIDGLRLSGPMFFGPRTNPKKWRRAVYIEDLRLRAGGADSSARKPVIAEEAFTPPDYVADTEEARLIDTAIGHLPLREQFIVRARLWEDLTLEETARRLIPMLGRMLSRERIRQIQVDAHSALRRLLRLAGVAPPQHANDAKNA